MVHTQEYGGGKHCLSFKLTLVLLVTKHIIIFIK